MVADIAAVLRMELGGAGLRPARGGQQDDTVIVIADGTREWPVACLRAEIDKRAFTDWDPGESGDGCRCHQGALPRPPQGARASRCGRGRQAAVEGKGHRPWWGELALPPGKKLAFPKLCVRQRLATRSAGVGAWPRPLFGSPPTLAPDGSVVVGVRRPPGMG